MTERTEDAVAAAWQGLFDAEDWCVGCPHGEGEAQHPWQDCDEQHAVRDCPYVVAARAALIAAAEQRGRLAGYTDKLTALAVALSIAKHETRRDAVVKIQRLVDAVRREAELQEEP